jgi:tetrahydromethanopterin S-methyltransferase subunit G
MHLMTEKWTDGRLDEFEKRVDERFDRVDERFDEVEKRLDKIESRMESIQKSLLFGVIAMTSANMAGFAALVTQI